MLCIAVCAHIVVLVRCSMVAFCICIKAVSLWHCCCHVAFCVVIVCICRWVGAVLFVALLRMCRDCVLLCPVPLSFCVVVIVLLCRCRLLLCFVVVALVMLQQ